MSIHRLTGLALIMLALAGCKTPPSAPAHPDASSVRVGKGDALPSDIEIGPISGVHGTGCGGIGFKGEYEGAVLDLKNRAAGMNANYVQIHSLIEPHIEPMCYVNEYFIRGTAYRRNMAAAPGPSTATGPVPPPTLQARLLELQQLRDHKLITPEEFDGLRAKALAGAQ
jgi:hypothetical protein